MFTRQTMQSVSPRQLDGKAGEFEVIDVREGDERRAGHIAGSRHIPLHELPQRVRDLERDQHFVLVCRSGQRSAQATAYLSQQGYDATNLDGGLKAWSRAGLPLTADDGGPGRVI